MGKVLLTIVLTLLAVFAWVFVGRIVGTILLGIDDDKGTVSEEREVIWLMTASWPFFILFYAIAGLMKIIDGIKPTRKPNELSFLQRFDKFFWQLGYRVRLLFVKG